MTTAINATNATDTATTGTNTDALSGLTGTDFLELLITQLTTQDPMEPMSNEEMMSQVSSIRDIEMNTTLTDTLQKLADDKQFGSASSLVGKYVTGLADETGQVQRGSVTAVQFSPDGSIQLQLDNGTMMKLDDVSAVTTVQQAASSLIGQMVAGFADADGELKYHEGMVTGVTVSEDGTVEIELDTGDTLPFSGVTNIGSEVSGNDDSDVSDEETTE